jgi:hypothetical protein
MDAIADKGSSTALLPLIGCGAGYIAVTVLALVIRTVTLNQYVGHIDEPASLLAIKRVAELGYPLYPSGVLYLQGAVFSYIAAPLTWIFSDTSLLHASRVLHLLLALSVVPLSIKLVHYVTDNMWFAVFSGILIAGDPNLIMWGVTIRPYGLLAAEIVAFTFLFTMLLKDGPEARLPVGRVVYWIPILATIGTFTHIGFWLTGPALALVAVLVWGKALLKSHRTILLSGMTCLIPLLAFLLLGRLVSSGSGTGDGNLGSSFVGSHLFNVQRLMEPPYIRWSLWTGNFSEGELHLLLPYLIALVSGVLIYAVLAPISEGSARWKMQTIGTLVLVHWSMIVAAALLVSTDPAPRYLNHVLPIGHILVALAAWKLWQLASPRTGISRWLVHISILVVLVFPALFHTATAASWRMEHSGGSPDYWEATAWTSENRAYDQVVITTLPSSAYFWFPKHQYDDLFFLAGPEEGRRAQRYIKPMSSGEPGDYWLGLQSIGSTEQLCSTLRDHAGNALIIVDMGRLSAPWALRGQFEQIIRGSALEQYRGHNGVVVMSVVPVEGWTPAARAECAL